MLLWQEIEVEVAVVSSGSAGLDVDMRVEGGGACGSENRVRNVSCHVTRKTDQ